MSRKRMSEIVRIATGIDLFATQLQETGRATAYPGDKDALLAALALIGVESFTVILTPVKAEEPDDDALRLALAMAWQKMVVSRRGDTGFVSGNDFAKVFLPILRTEVFAPHVAISEGHDEGCPGNHEGLCPVPQC